jgi:hypothetical protein
MFGRKKSVETITARLHDTIKELEYHAAHQAEQAAQHAVKIDESTVAKDACSAMVDCSTGG